MTYAVYDIETTAIEKNLQCLVRKVWAIGIKLIIDDVAQETKVYTTYHIEGTAGSLIEAKRLLLSADVIIGFNSISFDDTVLRSHWKVDLPTSLDLMIVAKLMFTKDELFAIDMDLGLPKEHWGSYSLKAFALRLGQEEKIEFEDWTKLSSEMVTYCKRDVDITYLFYEFLRTHPKFPLANVIELEMAVKRLIVEQETYGFYFNLEAARKLNTEMLTEKFKIDNKLGKTFTPRFLPEGKPQKTENLIKSKIWLDNPHYKPLLGTKR